jgi:hypothetical protein
MGSLYCRDAQVSIVDIIVKKIPTTHGLHLMYRSEHGHEQQTLHNDQYLGLVLVVQ